MTRHLLSSLALLALLGCSNDGSGPAGLDPGTARSDLGPADSATPRDVPRDAPADRGPEDSTLGDQAAATDPGLEPPGDCLDAPPAGLARIRSGCLEPNPERGSLAETSGDLVLENARVRFTVRAATSEGLMIMGTGAGGIVDAIPAIDGRFDPSRDHTQELAPIIDFRTLKDPVITWGMGAPGEPAWVRVSGETVPIPVIDTVLAGVGTDGVGSITWTLMPDEPFVRATVELEPAEGSLPSVTLGIGFMHQGDMRPYTDQLGFTDSPIGKARLLAGVSPRSSLGLFTDAPVPLLGASGLVFALLSQEPVAEGDVAHAEARVAVVPGDLMALRRATLDRDETLVPVDIEVEGGSIAPAGPALGVEERAPDGVLVRRTSLGADGKARLELPAGSREVRLAWRYGIAGAWTKISVPSADPVALAVPPAALIKVGATEQGGAGEAIPARVILRSSTGAEIRGSTGPAGPAELLVEPGTYAIYVTRGPEYEASVEAGVVVAAGDTVERTATLERVLDTSGWIACDFHLHSENSADSSLPLRQRVLEVAAEGIEFANSSDHDFATDYKPLRDMLGLGPFLQVTVGVEVSHPRLGHACTWPWPVDRSKSGQGAPRWDGKTPEERFKLLGMGDPSRIFQLNHPRGSSAYFKAIGYDPDTGVTQKSAASFGYPEDAPLVGFDYDAIEIYNGKRAGDLEEVFTDWRSLIAQGFHPAPTGTSDSHSSGAYPGGARTLVWVGEGKDDPGTVTAEDVRDGVLAGRVLVVGGALVEAWLVGPGGAQDDPAGVGQMRSEVGSEARLRVRVRAPSWMPVDEIRIYANRALVQTVTLAIPPGAAAPLTRYDEILSFPVEGDTFFSVLAESSVIPAPFQRERPISLVGPVYLDADGDGSFTPPGLP